MGGKSKSNRHANGARSYLLKYPSTQAYLSTQVALEANRLLIILVFMKAAVIEMSI